MVNVVQWLTSTCELFEFRCGRLGSRARAHGHRETHACAPGRHFHALRSARTSLRRLAAAPLRAKCARAAAACCASGPRPRAHAAGRARGGGVLLVGDSHLEFWDRASAALQPHAPVVNFGIAGDRRGPRGVGGPTRAGVARAGRDRLLGRRERPQVHGRDRRAHRRGLRALRRRGRAARAARALIFVAAIEPRGARARARAPTPGRARASTPRCARARAARARARRPERRARRRRNVPRRRRPPQRAGTRAPRRAPRRARRRRRARERGEAPPRAAAAARAARARYARGGRRASRGRRAARPDAAAPGAAPGRRARRRRAAARSSTSSCSRTG